MEDVKYIKIDCVRCGETFTFWTKGNIYPIVCGDCKHGR